MISAGSWQAISPQGKLRCPVTVTGNKQTCVQKEAGLAPWPLLFDLYMMPNGAFVRICLSGQEAWPTISLISEQHPYGSTSARCVYKLAKEWQESTPAGHSAAS